jgi:putative CocE/NonD family hydrolase
MLRIQSIFTCSVVFSWLAVGPLASERLAPPAKSTPEVDLSWAVKIPLRDKVQLNATIYQPAGVKDPVPAIVHITPYISDTYHDYGMFFAKNGYAFVQVDSRGRGNSGGEFEPFANEGKDGYDIVEWAAAQKWCDGKVGMWGGSYGGFNQWSTLKEFPPHLKTIVPVASAHPTVDLPAPQGIADAYFIRWMTMTAGTTGNTKLFGDEAFWISKFQKRYREHTPFQQLDTVVGHPCKHFQKWLKHRKPDAYWDAMVPSPADYAKLNLPILTITGHYDGDQLGAMEYFHRHMKHGSPDGKLRHFLVMGPWDHAGTRKPKDKVGGLTFGKLSLLDMNALHKAWYDWTLKDRLKPAALTSRTMCYAAGLERWKHYENLSDIPIEPRKLYLHSNGKANDVFQSGTLGNAKPGQEPQDKYTYDPLDVRPAGLEKEKTDDYLTDQKGVLNLFGNGLVYHSDPLQQETEVTGYFKFSVWIKLNVPDTDFQVQVYEIQPDGKSILLTDDRLRARYKDGFREDKLIKPGDINCFEFKAFSFTSRVLQKGSRLRLLFHCPNSIFIEKNYNSGGAVEAETAKDARAAEVTVYHDQDHPSCLDVPVVKKVEK